jgi:hypothetical protein
MVNSAMINLNYLHADWKNKTSDTKQSLLKLDNLTLVYNAHPEQNASGP